MSLIDRRSQNEEVDLREQDKISHFELLVSQRLRYSERTIQNMLIMITNLIRIHQKFTVFTC